MDAQSIPLQNYTHITPLCEEKFCNNNTWRKIKIKKRNKRNITAHSRCIQSIQCAYWKAKNEVKGIKNWRGTVESGCEDFCEIYLKINYISKPVAWELKLEKCNGPS